MYCAIINKIKLNMAKISSTPKKNLADIFNSIDDLKFEAPIRRIPIYLADKSHLSVQVGDGLYSAPRDNKGPYTKAEIGYPSKKFDIILPFIEDPNSDPRKTIYPYTPIVLIAKLILQSGGRIVPPKNAEKHINEHNSFFYLVKSKCQEMDWNKIKNKKINLDKIEIDKQKSAIEKKLHLWLQAACVGHYRDEKDNRFDVFANKKLIIPWEKITSLILGSNSDEYKDFIKTTATLIYDFANISMATKISSNKTSKINIKL